MGPASYNERSFDHSISRDAAKDTASKKRASIFPDKLGYLPLIPRRERVKARLLLNFRRMIPISSALLIWFCLQI